MIISLFMDTPDGGIRRATCVRVPEGGNERPFSQPPREEREQRERHQSRLVSSERNTAADMRSRIPAAAPRIRFSS
jgi:hypothetical protein